MNRKKQRGKHAVISGIRMPQLRCTRVSESGILRRVALALCACLLFTTVFVGCGTEASDEPVDPNKLQVMASFYTMYDFAQKIGGEHVQVTCMVPSGTEPHDWEPSTKDITRMEQSDVFIYNGAGMEHWVSDVLAGLSNKKLISVEASQGVSLLRSAEEEESHDHEAVHADEDEEDSHDHGTAHADEDGHDHADEEDAAVSNAAAHEDDAADHTVVVAPDGHDAHEHGEYDPQSRKCKTFAQRFLRRIRSIAQTIRQIMRNGQNSSTSWTKPIRRRWKICRSETSLWRMRRMDICAGVIT